MSRPTILVPHRVAGRALAVVVAGGLLISGGVAHAGGGPEQLCQQGRYNAAARYGSCHQKVLARVFSGRLVTNYIIEKLRKCRSKYAAAWSGIQAKASGTGATCDAARFVDNGDGTVDDTLTGLQWEKKQNLDSIENADPHDADNIYTWTVSTSAADGTTFTDFLPLLNNGCFAGHCDWRLPTFAESQTIFQTPTCTTNPCLDPVFGPTPPAVFWTDTTSASDPTYAWRVYSNTGDVQLEAKHFYGYVRAVRGGL